MARFGRYFGGKEYKWFLPFFTTNKLDAFKIRQKGILTERDARRKFGEKNYKEFWSDTKPEIPKDVNSYNIIVSYILITNVVILPFAFVGLTVISNIKSALIVYGIQAVIHLILPLTSRNSIPLYNSYLDKLYPMVKPLFFVIDVLLTVVLTPLILLWQIARSIFVAEVEGAIFRK